VLECRTEQRETRAQLKTKTEQCNKIKTQIDSVKAFLDKKTEQKK